MKRNWYYFTKIACVTLAVIGLCACSDDDDDPVVPSTNTASYSGKDITSYASVVSSKSTKVANVEVLEQGSWKIYNGTASEGVDFATPVLQGSSRGMYAMSGSTYKLYCLEWADGSRATYGLRQLPLEGQSNFRDLGGYKTQDGHYVKWGKVFRSGKCNELTDRDLMYLASIPLKTIVDFRSISERDAEPDKVPSTVVNRFNYNIETGNLGGLDMNQVFATGDTATAKLLLVYGNESFVLNNQNEYKQFFAALQNAAYTPLMFHCTAGKDRAGFAAALFLSSLGVDRETVIQDYLLTNALTGASLAAMKAVYGDNNMAVCMYYLYSVQRAYIEKAFSTIESNYGSVENFLTKQLGVDLVKMKTLYLY